MAAHAKGHQIIFQKMFSFGRGVWIVAVDAPLFDRVMLEFYLGHNTANILMTIETEFVPCFQKNKLVF